MNFIRKKVFIFERQNRNSIKYIPSEPSKYPRSLSLFRYINKCRRSKMCINIRSKPFFLIIIKKTIKRYARREYDPISSHRI